MIDSIRIPLGRSGTAEAWAVIDFEDYERVALYRWYVKGGYPFIAYARDRNTTYLHNYVLRRENASDGMMVDHIDRDPLNARKGNLRVVTQSENMLNTAVQDRLKIQQGVYGDVARRLYAQGLTLKQVAEGLGISLLSVTSYCEDEIPERQRPSRRRS